MFCARSKEICGQNTVDYRVDRKTFPIERHTLLKQLKVNDSAALLLADQRMPLHGWHCIFAGSDAHLPEAKRALLTAYADTNAAIDAINQASIHYFFLKPWGSNT